MKVRHNDINVNVISKGSIMATQKKAATKTTTTRKKTASKKVARPESFKAYADQTPFFTFRITHETFYWIILSSLVLALGVWVITLSMQVQRLYDQVEASNLTDITTKVVPKNQPPQQ